MENRDLIPEVTGRQLGIPNKRWDAQLRNVNISGTLTGTGIGIGAVVNNVPDTDTMLLSSDTGNAIVRKRLRLANTINADYVPFELQNVIPQFGTTDAGQGGGINSQYFSDAGDLLLDYLTFFQRGADLNSGLVAASITNDGELVNRANGYATYAMRAFNDQEAQPLFALKPSGEMLWGPGGPTIPDTGLKRSAVGTLQVHDGAGNDATMQCRTIAISAPNGVPSISMLSATLIPNLNSSLLLGFTWGAPPAIGDVTPNDGAFDALSAQTLDLGIPDGTVPITTLSKTAVDNLTVKRVFDVDHAGVIKSDTQGFKSKRITTGSVAANTRVSVAVNWTTAFPTGNYTVSAEVFDALTPGVAGLIVERILAQAADHVTLQVFNQDAAVARTGTLHVLAFRES